MKVVLIHGDDRINSRKRLLAIISNVKKRGWEVNRFNDVREENFLNKFTSGSLFGNKSLYVVEDAVKISANDLSWIKKKGEDFPGSLLLYSKTEVGARFKKALPSNTKIEEFKLPTIIFNMLDSIIPGNSRVFTKYYHELVRIDGQEFVLAVIARHMRDLYWVLFDEKSLGYPAWRTNKLRRQADRMGLESIKNIISDLSKVDLRSKLGKEDLVSGIDLVIAKELR